jgi:hypothetical protein
MQNLQHAVNLRDGLSRLSQQAVGLQELVSEHWRLDQFHVDLSCELGIHRGIAVVIHCRPINLGYEAAFGKSNASRCRMQLEVQWASHDASPFPADTSK